MTVIHLTIGEPIGWRERHGYSYADVKDWCENRGALGRRPTARSPHHASCRRRETASRRPRLNAPETSNPFLKLKSKSS